MNKLRHFITFFILLLVGTLPAQSRVWPGDANNNGIVNEADLFYLGLGFGQEGPARKVISAAFEAQPIAEVWATSAVGGLDFVFADCDGNGVIDDNDVDVIIQNFGKMHNGVVFQPDVIPEGIVGVSPAFSVTEDMDLAIRPNDKIKEIPLSLGSLDIPVTSLKGISFYIKVDPKAVNSNETSFSFDANGWLPDDENAQSFTIQQQTGRSGPGDLIVAYTRVGSGVINNGIGSIGTISISPNTGFILENDLEDFKISVDSIILFDELNNKVPILGTEITLVSDGFRDSTTIDTTICKGESILFNDSTLTESGTYRDTFMNAVGGDSIIILNLAVADTFQTMLTAELCAGASMDFNGSTLTQSGMYRDTLTAVNGCDSFIVLDLTVKDTFQTMLAEEICAGGSFDFDGQTLTMGGTYRDTLTATNGCDSFIVLNLSVKDTFQTNLSGTICDGGSLLFNGQTLTETGTYRDTLLAANGCDSFIVFDFTVLPKFETVLRDTICQGDQVDFGGNTYTEMGTYRDTMIAANGCDSVVVLNLNVEDTLQTLLVRTICAGDNFLFNGRTLTEAGTYRDTLIAANGCDQYLVLELSVADTLVTNVSQVICEGEVFVFDNQELRTEGTYEQILQAANGCDSLVILNLALLPTVENTISETICIGSVMDFAGQMLTESGTYNTTLTGANGCDSLLILNLTVADSAQTIINQTICEGSTYDFNGRSLSITGIYRDTLATINGCDSFIVLNLQTSDRYETEMNKVICEGESMNFNGRNITISGTYRDTFVAINGCDSLVALNLNVATISFTAIQAEICQGGSMNFNGQVLSETGTYLDTLQGVSGCDSLIELSLRLTAPLESVEERTICAGDTVNFYNFVLTTTNTYMVMLQTADGCDSMVIMNLQVLDAVETTVDMTICPQDSLSFGGLTLSEAGTYSQVMTSAAGCDSLVILNLAIGTAGEGGCMSVSIEEEFLESIEIYPNPVNQSLFINSRDVKMTDIRLINLTGQVLIERTYSNGSTPIQAALNLQNIVPGVYWVLIQTEYGLRQEKIVKM